MFEMLTVVTVLLANTQERHEVGSLTHRMQFEAVENCQLVQGEIGQTIEDSLSKTAQSMYEVLYQEIPVRVESYTTCSIAESE